MDSINQTPTEFTNNTIDTSSLPRFEEVIFRKLERDYLKIIIINIAIAFILVYGILVGFSQFVSDFSHLEPYVYIVPGIFLLLILLGSIIGFYNRGFAFREHDVLYKSGVLSTNIIIIPYNRVQHVALHEGMFPRMFGLSEVRVYTAGGGNSDIAIPGIRKDEAQGIKQLLMGKIQKTLE